MSDFSLPVLYKLGLQESINHLCKLINKTILSTTSDLLQANNLKHFEITCETVVPVIETYIPWLALGAVIFSVLTLYVLYYQCVIVGRPKVVCSPTRHESLIKHCPVFFEKYYPTIWAPLSYMQTIIRVALQTFPAEKRRRSVYNGLFVI